MKETTRFTDGKSEAELKEMATTALEHLGKISNKTISIPVENVSLSYKDLVKNIENLTPIGLAYMNAQLEILEYFEYLKERHHRVYKNFFHKILVQLFCKHDYQPLYGLVTKQISADLDTLPSWQLCSKCNKKID